MLLKKNNKESKVSGNRSHFSIRFWNKSREVRILIAVPDNAPCLHRNEAWHLGSFKK